MFNIFKFTKCQKYVAFCLNCLSGLRFVTSQLSISEDRKCPLSEFVKISKVFYSRRTGKLWQISLLFQTVISLCVIGAGWMWAFLWIMSAGNPMMDTPNGSVVFIKDAFMQVNRKKNR